jgi:hypothetical protein
LTAARRSGWLFLGRLKSTLNAAKELPAEVVRELRAWRQQLTESDHDATIWGCEVFIERAVERRG